jgi:hypothetical protein
VLEAPNIVNQQCSRAPAAVCVFSQQEPKAFLFSTFDPVNGNPQQVAKLEEERPAGWSWSLSPDGTLIALLAFGSNENRIRLLSPSGAPTREVTVKGWNSFTTVDWAADGKGLFVTSPTGRTSTLLYVDLTGNAHSLWQVNSYQPAWAIPSRNISPFPRPRWRAMCGWWRTSECKPELIPALAVAFDVSSSDLMTAVVSVSQVAGGLQFRASFIDSQGALIQEL